MSETAGYLLVTVMLYAAPNGLCCMHKEKAGWLGMTTRFCAPSTRGGKC